ncbi:GntR family transcriptional regulator [Bacillus anthracis]|nr:GntR family transcriptional regulator [Bacillus anthracis]
MHIIISNSSQDPIYVQISAQLSQLILLGGLKGGDAFPSMRKLAKELQVSVITTKRAYEELEKDGFINSIVGRGSFVAEQNIETMKEEKLKTVEEKLCEAIQNAKPMDVSLNELKEMLTILYEEENSWKT